MLHAVTGIHPPGAVIEAKVTDYLKKSAALEEYWQRPITAQQLQAEMDRMAKGTKDPATLRELFAALHNDSYLIAECLARPILADRLIHNGYAYDTRFHGELKAAAEALRNQLTPANFSSLDAAHFHAVKMELEDPSLGPDGKSPDTKTMRLGEDDFRKAAGEYPETGAISQVEETAEAFIIRWTESRTDKSLDGGVMIFEKTSFDAWFEGAARNPSLEVFPTEGTYTLYPLSSGTSLDSKSPDTWTATFTGANCPSPRYLHTAVWTGTEMIVWGGNDGTIINSGGWYTPSSDSWTATSTGANCPSGREFHTAVWTGTEMIVWGGNGGSYLNTGGRYTPSSDSWTATSTGANCPSPRFLHTAVWTGTEMIVWGGYDGTIINSGGCYTPSSDSWTATSTGAYCPSGREFHTVVWTGTQMIVWGGTNGSYLNTGGQYTPTSDSWTATSTGANCPTGRYEHTAVWTGTQMIVWGGYGGSYISTGGIYYPSSCTAPGAPSITSITDVDPCAASGIQIAYTAGSGAASHNLLKDGTVVMPGYTSGATYIPGDTSSHTYIVQAVSGSCTTNSTASVFADAAGPCPPPAEDAPGTSSSTAQSWAGDKSTQSWPPVSGATSYTLYRGVLAGLPNLLNNASDSCTKYTGAGTSATDTSDPSMVTGRLYWYLVTASNAYGEGPAGNATAGARIVNSTGTCPL